MLLSAACVPRWTIRLRPSLSTPFAALVMFSKRTERRSIASTGDFSAAACLRQGFGGQAKLGVGLSSSERLSHGRETVFARHPERRVWQPTLYPSGSAGPVKRRASRKKFRCFIHHSSLG